MKKIIAAFDNGDILQGQPISYFYNYVNTDEEKHRRKRNKLYGI